MKSYLTMLKTELKLSLRGMDMVIFAIFMPIIILIILGLIYGKQPAFDGASYTFVEQSFGAIASIAIVAGGVMGLPLVISDYREKQILKRYQVTPIRPIKLLLVQVTIYTLYAFLSLVSLMIIAKLFFSFSISGSLGEFIFGWLIVLISMFSIGIMVGGIAKNTKIAGIIASLLYFPMLIFSGATLPYEIMPLPMQKVVDVLPLTQGIKILKAATLGIPLESTLLPIIILACISLVCSFIAIRFFRWE
jgi:ABC-2 type transport system permease protein